MKLDLITEANQPIQGHIYYDLNKSKIYKAKTSISKTGIDAEVKKYKSTAVLLTPEHYHVIDLSKAKLNKSDKAQHASLARQWRKTQGWSQADVVLIGLADDISSEFSTIQKGAEKAISTFQRARVKVEKEWDRLAKKTDGDTFYEMTGYYKNQFSDWWFDSQA